MKPGRNIMNSKQYLKQRVTIWYFFMKKLRKKLQE